MHRSLLTGRRVVALGPFLLTIVALVAMAACQEKLERTVSLTQEQWKRVQGTVAVERPEPTHPVGAVFGQDGKALIELVGFDIDPSPLVTGEKFNLTWHWHALAPIQDNWKIFVHIQPVRGGNFQNLDHHPVDNLFQTSLWQKGDFIADIQNATLQAGFPSTGAYVNVGFFHEQTGKRLDVLSIGNATEVEPGKVRVAEVPTRNDKILTAFKVDTPPVIDGDIGDAVWRLAGRTNPLVNAGDGQTAPTSTVVRALYTDTALYFAFDVKDTDIRSTFTKRDDRLWEQDCVEIYLNPDQTDGTYWEIQISPQQGPDGQALVFDAFFERRRQPAWEIAKEADIEGLQAAVQVRGTLNSEALTPNDTGYVVEVMIPFASLTKTPRAIERINLPQIPPAEGESWRVNFFRVDYQRTADGAQTRHHAWSPAGGDFHNLDAFGVLEFGPPRSVAPPGARPHQEPPAEQSPATAAPATPGTLSLNLVRSGSHLAIGPFALALNAQEPALTACLAELERHEHWTADIELVMNDSAEIELVRRISMPPLPVPVLDCLVASIESGMTNDQKFLTQINGEAQDRTALVRILYTPGPPLRRPALPPPAADGPPEATPTSLPPAPHHPSEQAPPP